MCYYALFSQLSKSTIHLLFKYVSLISLCSILTQLLRTKDAHSVYKYLSIRTFVVQGPVVQSIVSLTSSLVVKMLTVLVSTISNSEVFC